MPDNYIFRTVVEKLGVPVAAPSANLSTKPSGTCVDDIKDDFEGKVYIIIDGGKSDLGIESTIVRVIDGVPVILRPGFITEEDIKKVAGTAKLSDKLLTEAKEGEKLETI